MMHSTFFRVVGAILVILAILAFLFRGALVAPLRPAPTIHSRLTPGASAGK